nr:sulfite exporter TauE/SafE family protein [Deltaproteobacteria bacterium]
MVWSVVSFGKSAGIAAPFARRERPPSRGIGAGDAVAAPVLGAGRVWSTVLPWASYFASGVAAGTVNSVAGGGSMLTFPTLLAFGMAPITANATNTVALIPGSASAFWGYRDVLAGSRSLVLAMALPSAAGGVLGAWLALRTGDARFTALIPWLLLGATGLFALQEPVARRLRLTDDGVRSPASWAGLMVFQLVVATYGGFFGAGIGILMLAALGMMGVRDIHRANGLKNLAAVCINGVASVTFVAGGRVAWAEAAVMAAGAVLGGALGAGTARKVGPRVVRRAVMTVGVALAAAMFWRRLRG